MDNITTWADSLEAKNYEKPAKKLQEELFQRITTELSKDVRTAADCAAVLFRFAGKVTEAFYDGPYGMMSADVHTLWDTEAIKCVSAMLPVKKSMITIALMIQKKLPRCETASGIMGELQWLAVNGEDKSAASAYKLLKEKSTVNDLRKLLTVDTAKLEKGVGHLGKMFSYLFEDSMDEKTQEMFRAFLIQNGLDKAPAPKARKSGGKKTISAEDASQDPVALAEALLKWVKAKSKQSAEKPDETPPALSNDTLRLEAELRTANERIKALEAENAAANESIAHLEQMFKNSVTQKADGFRYTLTNELKKTVEDFYSDVSDFSMAEKADFYQALLEEMVDTLRHNGIITEGKD